MVKKSIKKFRCVHFRTPWSQALGLRLRKPLPGTLYVFNFGKEVHHKFSMWWVFSPIDIYFLDAESRIVELKKNFRPFTAYRPTLPYSAVVETAPGLLSLKIGQKLDVPYKA